MDTFLCDQIPIVENHITLLNDVIDQLLSADAGAVVTYSFDDGQTKQTVTRRNLTSLENYLNKLLNKRDILRQRCGIQSGAVQVVPFR